MFLQKQTTFGSHVISKINKPKTRDGNMEEVYNNKYEKRNDALEEHGK